LTGIRQEENFDVFTANHRQHLLVAFRHLDAMLEEVLARIGAAPGTPLFQSHRDDADARMRESAQQAVTNAREAMRAFMTKHGLEVTPPDFSATHAAHAMLALMQVGAMELDGHHLRGYGELSADELDELDELSHRLRERLGELDRVLNERNPGGTH
jgi:leucyl aminopeptidase (aminopeptidase T)